MGTKTWLLMSYDQHPAEVLNSAANLDRDATDAYVAALFPNDRYTEVGSTTLLNACASGRQVYAACYEDVSILSCKGIAIDHPSKLPQALRMPQFGRETCSICIYSVVDWFAMSIWQAGELVRSVSVSPDSGVMQDIGSRIGFETPYWNGDEPAIDPSEAEDTYPLPFHPLDLGETALLNQFGYQIEGYPEAWKFDPEDIALITYQRPGWWKFW